MVLSFKPQFVDKILDGSKIHTIREDKGSRWRKDMEIHFATGARTKAYKQFHYRLCTGVQEIKIIGSAISIRAGAEIIKYLSSEEKALLAKNDGFDSLADFLAFFKGDFRGTIIHWTDFKY